VAVQVNDKAPAFTLHSDNQEQVSLSDYQGRNLVINFFPLAFTGVCTEQMCSMRDALAQYNSLDTEVVGISVDSIFTLAKFKEAEKLTFPLLSDFNKEVSRQYGALYEEFVMGMRGVSRRAAFVIDKEGVIRYAEVLESAGDLPNFAAIKATLEEIQ
jgi:peroxiredoxin